MLIFSHLFSPYFLIFSQLSGVQLLKSSLAFDISFGFLCSFLKMAFLGRVGNLLKQSRNKHASIGLSSTNSPLFQAIRSMSSAKLFIAGLPYATDEMRLKDAFQQYGEVIDVMVITDRDSGRSRGFGFVRYFSADDANTALQEMNGKELYGRKIKISFAEEKPHPFYGDADWYRSEGYGRGHFAKRANRAFVGY
ncbi:hypothetical protein L6452_44465 [Arctium lappa]|uniref:Uncharacterized protein n=1 Tax=Arctium lappa TaxID=4217 RepID=A0ACB8XJU3_ARCLA|nr:hypothetical protein L6452_44465 [Arctium lappa]